MAERNVVQRAFDAFGRSVEGQKKSGSWYVRRPELISVTNLQKSQYGSWYFVNQGFWLTALGGAEFPRYDYCHIVGRIEDYFPDDQETIRQLLDLESPMEQDARYSELLGVLGGRLGGLIGRATTLRDVAKLATDGHLGLAGIGIPARALLNLPIPTGAA